MDFIVNKDIQVYTALFNLKRENIDGRDIETYLNWLEQTISYFPDILVYHDGSVGLERKNDDRFIFVERNKLKSFSNLEIVNSILDSFIPLAKSDITFRLPEYSLVQFSKFELGKLAIQHSNARSLLWVDAGISRFIKPHTLFNSEVDYQARNLLEQGVEFVLEIDLKNNIDFNRRKIRNSLVGSCRRVISGTSFWYSSNFCSELNSKIEKGVMEWLKAGIWDNEQVMLRNLSPFSVKTKYIIQSKSPTGGVARSFLSKKLLKYNLIDKLIEKALR